MKNKKAFTLIEVLASIVILSIIVLVAFNLVVRQTNRSRRNAFITDIQQFIKSTSYDTLVKDRMDEYVLYNFPNSGIDILSKDADSGFMIKDENDLVRIQIWNSKLGLCAVKSFTDTSVKINDDIKTEEECNSFLPNLTEDEIDVKPLVGENVDFKLKASCFTLDEDNKIDDFNTDTCGTVLVIPNKINGNYVNGFTSDFKNNAPVNFTSFYMVGVKNVSMIPAGFLTDNYDVKKMVISKDENLTTIQSGFLSCLHGDNSLETLVISNNPNLTTISSGNLSGNNPDLTNLTLENLPKLTSLSAVFYRAPLKKLNLVNLDSLETISSSSFSGLNGETELTIKDNDNLVDIKYGAFGGSDFKKVIVTNNPKFKGFIGGSFGGSGGHYIDYLEIGDNPLMDSLKESAFNSYEITYAKLYNIPNLKSILYSAFGDAVIETLDLGETSLETFDTSAFGSSQINTLILPTTITSINAGYINSIVKNQVYAGGNNKCALINLFRTTNPDNTYTYLIDKNKLPDCP